MGVYIKGVEMPTSCSKCTFGDGYACYVTGLIVQDEEWEHNRASFCPLIYISDRPQAKKRCGNCDKTDGCVYTSLPPKTRCTVTGKFHFNDDVCDLPQTNLIKGVGFIDRKGGYVVATGTLDLIREPIDGGADNG